jgi:hypothetical protein
VTDRTPDLAADLELVVHRTGHERYRVLCDPESPSYHPGYVEHVRREAARLRLVPGPDRSAPSPRIDPAGEADWIAAVRRCPHRGRILPPREGCGCNELWPCAARRGTLDGGAVARTADCLACVRKGGPP